MVLTENGRPGSDNLAFTGSLNTSGGSSIVSTIPRDGSIILGEKAQRGNKYDYDTHDLKNARFMLKQAAEVVRIKLNFY